MVSLFKENTDIIEKGVRESIFSHELYLTIGKSYLILDALLVKGNSADSQQADLLLERQ